VFTLLVLKRPSDAGLTIAWSNAPRKDGEAIDSATRAVGRSHHARVTAGFFSGVDYGTP